MNPILHALPLDWTGEQPGNRTKEEFFDLTNQFDLPFRVAVMRNGYFFTDTMRIVDNKQYELKEGKDYKCLGFLSEAADHTAKTVCSVIVIINTKVSHLIYVDAQMLGGGYCSVSPTIAEAALGLVKTSRKVHWNNITGKPDEFRANGHLHALWELFGFTPQVAQLKRMVTSFEKEVQKDFDELLRLFDANMKPYEDMIAGIEAQLISHIADVTTNPHQDTKVQLQLNNVMDYPKASLANAQTGNASIMNRYATPYSMNIAISVNYTQKLNEHVNNRNNPHRLTAAQLNIYTIDELNTLLVPNVIRGTTVERSTNMYGQSAAQLVTAIRRNNNTANLVPTVSRLTCPRISKALNWPGRNYYLGGDQNWYLIANAVRGSSSLMTTQSFVYIPEDES